jgi:hypothetical protein
MAYPGELAGKLSGDGEEKDFWAGNEVRTCDI